MARKVLVLGEVRDGSLRNVSFEAIAAGKTVAEGGEVIGVLAGKSVSALGQELIQYGADKVITVENDKLDQYTSDGYSQALMAVIEQEKPEGIVFG
ncbi:electron transfer flavoprotein subunit alpha/FixB family protein, partial [Bacillus haikouensis]|nr:electron transfer flavoprotein subunit alpha/FixB family protein [Bacillus haikouensis]